MENNTQRNKCFIDTQKKNEKWQEILTVISQQELHVPHVPTPKKVDIVTTSPLLGIDPKHINVCASEGGLQSYRKTLPEIIKVRSLFLEQMKVAMPYGKEILFVLERIVDMHGDVNKEELLKEVKSKFSK